MWEALLCRVLVVIKDVFEDYLDIYSPNITRRASRITWTHIHRVSLVVFLVNGLRLIEYFLREITDVPCNKSNDNMILTVMGSTLRNIKGDPTPQTKKCS